MRILLLCLLLPIAALAQHVHDDWPAPAAPAKPASAPARAASSIVVPKAADPDQREHWAGAVITPHEGETVDHASMHALPIGTGAAADGGAWLRVDTTGTYVIHNAEIVTLPGVKPPISAILYAGRVYRIKPHAGPLLWTPPGGMQAPVPIENLIPPMVAGQPGAGRPYP